MAKKVNQLDDVEIKQFIKNNIRFDAKVDGGGLYLRFRQTDRYPVFFFRFKIAGVENKILLGKYPALSLARARKDSGKHRTTIDAGRNPATIKREDKAKAAAKAIADKSASTVSQLVDEFFLRKINGRCKTAHAMRLRVDKYLIPAIGKLKIVDVQPMHISSMLNGIVDAGAPRSASDILGFSKQLFNQAIKNHTILHSPAAAFNCMDAGGIELPRKRNLSEYELIELFKAMSAADKFTRHHYLVTKLLLLIGCRKGELFKAKREDFDLINATWIMSIDNKTESAITIPLSNQALEIINELMLFQVNEYLLPAYRTIDAKIGYVSDSYLNKPIKQIVYPLMTNVDNFTIHDLRRTMRTHLGKMGVDRFVAERCLNHKIVGMEGIYDAGDYLPERRVALEKWADFLISCEVQANT
jgi:integrase